MYDINSIWSKIINHSGETFTQIRGQKFTYELNNISSAIMPSTTNQWLTKSVFEEALKYMPLNSTKEIQHLRGPSYLYAILMDDRICGGK